MVPDKVTLRLDRRIIPEENAAELEATLTQQIKADQQSAPQAIKDTKATKEEVPFEFPPILGGVSDPSVKDPKEVSFQLNKAFKNAIATAGHSTPRLGERFSAFA